MKKEVYCINCKYMIDGCGYDDHLCDNEKNVTYSVNSVYGRLRHKKYCKDINRDCDCPVYEPSFKLNILELLVQIKNYFIPPK